MGQKTNPIGNRLGIIRGWDSNWYAGASFADKVVEDERIRKYLDARINRGGISRIVIERTLRRITITIHTNRPGVIIGRGGQEVDKIREELRKITSQDVQINILEIRRPEVNAAIVAESIAKQLEGRMNHRRAIKSAIQSTMRAGAEGIKVRVSGRLNGAEMARREEYKQGRTPLHTFRADIDYSLVEAMTVQGKIGVKVWICKGEVLGKRDLSPNIAESPARAGAGNFSNRGDDRRGGNDRRGEGRGDGRGDRRGGGNDRGGRGSRGGNDRRGGGGGGRSSGKR